VQCQGWSGALRVHCTCIGEEQNACASFGVSGGARWLQGAMRYPTTSASHLHATRMCHPNMDSYKLAMAKDLKATPRKMRAFGWNDEWNLLPFEVAPVF